ncbi:hypothetical protein JCM19992_19460 [Thermostilla marina]
MEGLIIEAEQYAQRVPDDGTFAEPFAQGNASAGMGLFKFFPSEGRCEWKITFPEAGTTRLWVRYAAGGSPMLRYRLLDPAGKELSAGRLNVEPTGDLEVWGWELLGELSHPVGVVRLEVQGAPLRLDCFWLGNSDPPNLEDLMAAQMARVRSHLEHPIEPIAPDWLTEADEYRLPEWYDSIRVCAHTRLSWSWNRKDPDRFLHAGERLATLGFHEIVRHIKTGSEGAWWPSSVGAVLPQANKVDYAKQIIDEAHAAGCRIIVYHRHMEDDAIAEAHPEWVAKDFRGEPLVKRGTKICFNTPYADFVEKRLVELAERGADGFYFDEVHMPKPFCWCDNCRKAFQEATGMEYPRSPNPFDPAYQKAIEFKNVTIERVFRKWRAAIHAVNPECVLLISSNSYPQMSDRHTTHRLYRIADAMKTEFSLPARASGSRIFATDPTIAPTENDARLALGYAIARDATDGRPPHVWTHGLPNGLHARFATAGLIVHGCVANLDHPENTIPDPELFADAVALGNRLSPAYAGKKPIRFAAIHFSEYARDYYLPDESAAWKKVLYPVYGAFTTCLRDRLPVGIVTDSQLAQGRLDGYRVLFLPAPDRLTDEMRREVEKFEAAGGLVVRQKPEWEWHRPNSGMAEASSAFRDTLRSVWGDAPYRITGGPAKMHAVAFADQAHSEWTIGLVNDFSWVFTGHARLPSGEFSPAYLEALRFRGPEPCRNVRVVVNPAFRVENVREIITGRTLEVRQAADGSTVIDVPDFECAAVVTFRVR